MEGKDIISYGIIEDIIYQSWWVRIGGQGVMLTVAIFAILIIAFVLSNKESTLYAQQLNDIMQRANDNSDKLDDIEHYINENNRISKGTEQMANQILELLNNKGG